MLNDNFIYLAVVLSAIGGLKYFLLTLQGKVKPDKVTWLLWGLIPMIIFFLQYREGVGEQLFLTFIVGLIPLMIFAASFINKKSFWKISKLDIFSGSVAVVAIILWLLTRDGVLAIFLSVSANALAGVPTVVKSFNDPDSEHFIGYILTAVAAGITLLTINVWNFATYSFSVYLLLMSSLITFLIISRIGKKLE